MFPHRPIAGQTILVTGAGGFIGGAITKRLADEGARVRAFSRHVPNHMAPSSRVEWFIGDVTDPEATRQAMSGCDSVVHCAARHLTRGPRTEFHVANVVGTGLLARAFADCSPTKHCFLHVSTINVHGLPPPRSANADSPLRYSGDPYSDSKVDGEMMISRMARELGFPVTIVRPACTYGPNGTAWTLTPVQRLKEGRPVLIGRGEGMCNPVYIDNLVDIILMALESDNAAGEALIGSDGVGVQWRDFYQSYARMLGTRRIRSIPYGAARAAAEILPWLDRARGRPFSSYRANVAFYHHRVVFEIDKTRRLLGYEPKVDFETGMARTEAWLRESGVVNPNLP